VKGDTWQWPCTDNLIGVGLNPGIPFQSAGILTDPAMSLPIPQHTEPLPIKAPSPELEPPGDLS